MQQKELARTLARKAGVTPAAANDQIADMVCQILEALRKGEAVTFPGMGKLTGLLDQPHRTRRTEQRKKP